MKQFKAGRSITHEGLIILHNALCDYLEENQWQRDNVYAEGFNDGAYQQRTVSQENKCPCGRKVADPYSRTVCSNYPHCQEDRDFLREALLKLTE